MLSQNNAVTGTILVADDEPANRDLMEELLTTQGFCVITAANGAEALDRLGKVPIDLVLLDVMMPRLTGFQVCETIKVNPDTYLTPVILITALRRAGVVHDIGKIALPDSILLKPTSLSPDEWKLVREHPAVGERICAPLKSFRLVLPIIRHHHEKFDGSGYPDGLHGENIPITARVLQIVDVYDALTTVRPYKPAFSITDTLQTMKQEVMRGWWDPNVFDNFERLTRSGTADFLSRGAAAGR